jgi:hypothetical protein
MGYGLDGRCSILGRGIFFSLLHSVQTSSGAHSASCPMGAVGSTPGVKQSGREADHSPPSSAEVKVELYLHTPVLIKHRDNFTVLLPL